MKKRLIVEDDRWTLAAPGARLKSANGEFLAFAVHNPDLTVANSQMNGLGVAAEEVGVAGFLGKQCDPVQSLETIERTLASTVSPTL